MKQQIKRKEDRNFKLLQIHVLRNLDRRSMALVKLGARH